MLVLVSLASMLVMTGCSSEDEKQPDNSTTDAQDLAQNMELDDSDVTKDGIKNDAVVMVVGKEEITYSEIIVYIQMLKQQYEPVFTEDIWDFSVSKDQTFEDMAKDEIINQIARLKIMGFEAKNMDVKLNDDEKLEIEDSAVEFLQNVSMDDQKKYGITPAVIEKIYTDNYLAEKMFNVMMADVETNVTDEEATAVKVKQIKIVFNGMNKDGKALTGTDEQKNSALKRIQTIYDSVTTKSKKFDYYAERYSDESEISMTLIRGESPEYIDNAVFELKKGEYSQVVEGENAYYIFYCVNDKDKSNLAENKEKIIARRQDDYFNERYSQWLKDYDTFIVTELWNMIKFNEV